MYDVKTFEEDDHATLFQFIQDNRLGAIVTAFNGELNADHIPFLCVQEPNQPNRLQAHIAKANTLYKQLLAAPETTVLVIFQASSTYISPNWYPEKKVHQKVVPTWNYQAVHIQGKIRLIDEPEQILNLLHNLTEQEEQKLIQNPIWEISDAPQEYLNEMLKHIVGIEIDILNITGKFKLSQNKTAETIASVQQNLKRQTELKNRE